MITCKQEKIRDPSVTKPEEWVDEEDGDWEHPMIGTLIYFLFLYFIV
jgi:hypothetical protein